MLTRIKIKIFPVSNYKQDAIYRNKNSSAFSQKIPGHHHRFPWLSMTFHDLGCFPWLSRPGKCLTKFHDFLWLSRKSGHPVKMYHKHKTSWRNNFISDRKPKIMISFLHFCLPFAAPIYSTNNSPVQSMTQPTVSKHWRKIGVLRIQLQSHQVHLTMLQ